MRPARGGDGRDAAADQARQGWLATTSSRGRWEGPSSGAPGGTQPCRQLGLILLAPRIGGRTFLCLKPLSPQSVADALGNLTPGRGVGRGTGARPTITLSCRIRCNENQKVAGGLPIGGGLMHEDSMGQEAKDGKRERTFRKEVGNKIEVLRHAEAGGAVTQGRG